MPPIKKSVVLVVILCIALFSLNMLLNIFANPYAPPTPDNTNTSTCSYEIDKTAVVTKIIDGDSFETTAGEVRLADIDCPEYYESGYDQAKNALQSQISGKTLYLDVDDKYMRDQYGRYVCVVYVRYDAKHIMNINKYLLTKLYAQTSNYDNEFNPYTWSLFCESS